MAVLDVLKLAGYDGVIAGGAVRDTFLGREPKDFDIVLYGANSAESVAATIEKYFVWYSAIEVCSAEDYILGEEKGANSPSQVTTQLTWVIKLHLDGVEIDILEFASQPYSPVSVVEGFDCTLNMAWFSDTGEPELHSMFPNKPGDRVYILPTCDYPIQRTAYLKAKFPEYVFPTAEELARHPNAENHKCAAV